MPIRVKQHKRTGKNKVSIVRQHVKKSKPKTKVDKVMKEWKTGTLHSGSKKGAVVRNRKQAIAIALSEAGKSKSRSHLKKVHSKTGKPIGDSVRGSLKMPTFSKPKKGSVFAKREERILKGTYINKGRKR